ncbi:hypothetical protein FHR74_001550 [Sphingomonas aerolata]|nr:hypothetical protein [Sphingomonas aerolata]
MIDRTRNRGSLADQLRRATWLADLAAADEDRQTGGGVVDTNPRPPIVDPLVSHAQNFSSWSLTGCEL